MGLGARPGMPNFLLSVLVDKVQTKILSSTSMSRFGSQIKDCTTVKVKLLKGNFTDSTVWNTGETGDLYTKIPDPRSRY